MRIPDRHWWLWIVGAFAFIVGAVLLSYDRVAHQLPLDHLLGTFTFADTLLGIGYPLFLVAAALVITVEAGRRRAHFLSRRSALAGSLAAMPPARIGEYESHVSGLAAEPLVLTWCATRRTQQLTGCFLMPVVGLTMLFGVAVLGVTVWSALVNPAQLLALHLCEWPNVIQSTVVTAVCIPGAILFVRYIMLAFLGRRYGVIAADSGIAGQTWYGHHFAVTWDEMRLLEIEDAGLSTYSTADRRIYRVYGAHEIAEWYDQPRLYHQFAPAGMTPAEMARRLSAMAALIHARTGLVPRTCSRALRAAEPAAAEPLTEAGG